MEMRLARAIGILVGALTVTTFFVGSGIREVSAGSQAHISIDFESGWDSSWSANDYDSNSGLDYWGISTNRSYSGTHSVWCAEVGTNSVDGLANNVDHYYDQDMNAWLEIPIGDISTWSSATFSFYVWYVTGSWSLADYLLVANSSDGTTYWGQWTQTELSSYGWQQISFSLTTSTTSVAFIFISDPTVGMGPYEGVYVDNIVVTVTDSQNPVSSASALPPYQTSSSFSIPYTASDLGGSGLAYVELYYRTGTSGAFTLYTTTTSSSGHWTASPIEFDSSMTAGDGTYQFYTSAVDTLGNQETAPLSPDATTTVDTAQPSTTITLSGALGLDGRYTSPVSITLLSSDETSGVASTFYLIDSGDWQTYSGNFSISAEGAHIVYFHAFDNAGNGEYEQFVYVYIDIQAPTTIVQLFGTTGVNDWYVGDSVSVELLSGDYGSSVNSTKYRIDNGTWQTYSGSRIAIDKEGTTVIDYYAIDDAGNVESQQTVSFRLDSTAPAIAITYPLSNTKVSKDSVMIEWNGADYVSGIDHYEVQIDGGTWIPMGTATSYELKGLQDKWYSVTVRAFDKSGNNATSTTSFGIYTSVWSTNGPYGGAPLFAAIAVIVMAALASGFWLLKKRKPRAPKEVRTLKEKSE
jgi:hypothetical protein